MCSYFHLELTLNKFRDLNITGCKWGQQMAMLSISFDGILYPLSLLMQTTFNAFAADDIWKHLEKWRVFEARYISHDVFNPCINLRFQIVSRYLILVLTLVFKADENKTIQSGKRLSYTMCAFQSIWVSNSIYYNIFV